MKQKKKHQPPGGGKHVMPDEAINHPTHYTEHPSGIECITIVEHMTFNIGNAMKYLWRSGLKKTTTREDDLRKAVWYIERERKRCK